ncbi:MAG TPA: hypothetical protein VF735_13375 [Pyrinomonadaceae bacterium]|jgi:hypothetical protein
MESSTESENLFDESGSSSGAAGFTSVDELNRFAQDYFAQDFPNPKRHDCPAAGTLSSFIHSGKLPPDELRAHLFGCSECLGEYQQALAAHRNEIAAARAQTWWNRLTAGLPRAPLPIFASAFSLLLLMLVGAYIWRARDTGPNQAIVSHQDSAPAVDATQNSGQQNNAVQKNNAVQTPSPPPLMPAPSVKQPAIAQPPDSVSPPKPPTAPSRTREQRQGALLAQAVPATFKVDLDEYAVTRGGSSTSTRPLMLPRSRTRLLLTLPEGSRAGLYTVSIVGASERALVSANGQSKDGKTLSVILNMQDLSSQRYRLRVAHAGEPPDDYPISISDERPPPAPVKTP